MQLVPRILRDNENDSVMEDSNSSASEYIPNDMNCFVDNDSDIDQNDSIDSGSDNGLRFLKGTLRKTKGKSGNHRSLTRDTTSKIRQNKLQMYRLQKNAINNLPWIQHKSKTIVDPLGQ